LREHKEDIIFLAQQFMPRFARKHGARVHGIADDTLAALEAHDWPGNVRELQNVIERAVILCGDSGLLEPEHLGFSGPGVAAQPVTAASPAFSAPALPASDAGGMVSLAEVEKRHILAALEKSHQNRTHAAKVLGISIRTLRNKLAEYGVKGKDAEAAEAGGAEE
jgi:DNA-binding NtrC family response regulator